MIPGSKWLTHHNLVLSPRKPMGLWVQGTVQRIPTLQPLGYFSRDQAKEVSTSQRWSETSIWAGL